MRRRSNITVYHSSINNSETSGTHPSNSRLVKVSLKQQQGVSRRAPVQLISARLRAELRLPLKSSEVISGRSRSSARSPRGIFIAKIVSRIDIASVSQRVASASIPQAALISNSPPPGEIVRPIQRGRIIDIISSQRSVSRLRY